MAFLKYITYFNIKKIYIMWQIMIKQFDEMHNISIEIMIK